MLDKVLARLAILLLVLIWPQALLAQDGATPWREMEHSRIRLIWANDMPYQGRTVTAAGLQIELEKGWKTYWRTPGDGLAPSIGWGGSDNVGEAEILWPAPKRIESPPGVLAYGYERALTLPLVLTAKDPAQPMTLTLQVQIGVCADLCIPVEVELAAVIPLGGGAADNAGTLAAALRRVPRRQEEGAGCAHRFTRAALSREGGGAAIVIETAHASGASGLDLFAERPDGLFLPPSRMQADSGGGSLLFSIPLDAAEDAEALYGLPLTLTMTSDQGSCETVWRVE